MQNMAVESALFFETPAELYARVFSLLKPRMARPQIFRREVPAAHRHRYRLYMNRKDVRSSIHRVRKERGRKVHRGPQGEIYNLVALFEELNLRFFHGLMARPEIGWSGRRSKTLLGQYDPSHHAKGSRIGRGG